MKTATKKAMKQTAPNRLRVVLLATVVAAATLAAAPARGGETPIPPAPSAFVTDRAGFLSPGFVTQLSHQLEDYERGTGHQLIVWVDKTTGGVPIEDWAVRAFKAWGVGHKGHDDGIALFVFSDDRRMRIEVGYGLEDKVPDARAGRIIQYDIAPRLRVGDHDGAIKAGVDSLIAAAGGAPEPKGRSSDQGGQLPNIAFWLIAAAVVLIVNLIRRRRYPGGFTYIGGGWGGGGWGGGGGGWGGGGGGFSGGGGSSGGGGASGGW
jgi:uncharacterized protein